MAWCDAVRDLERLDAAGEGGELAGEAVEIGGGGVEALALGAHEAGVGGDRLVDAAQAALDLALELAGERRHQLLAQGGDLGAQLALGGLPPAGDDEQAEHRHAARPPRAGRWSAGARPAGPRARLRCARPRRPTCSTPACHCRRSAATSQSITSWTRRAMISGAPATTCLPNSALIRALLSRSMIRPRRMVSSKNRMPRLSNSCSTPATSARRKRKSRALSSR